MPRRTTHLSSLRDREAADLARRLRRALTPPERRLWYYLRLRPLERTHFRKQAPLGPYVVDFLCESKRLVIEVDGASHAEARVHDEQRTEWLARHGYRVLRFWNHEVMGNIEGVMAEVERAVAR